MRHIRRQSHDVVQHVPSSVYDRDYFLSEMCEGLSDYLAGGVSAIKQRELDLLGVESCQRVLDLGCGRGEVVADLGQDGGADAAD